MKTNLALSALNAVSPLDGRYASRCELLRPLLSEAGFMAHRVEVEVAWLLGLSEAGLVELKPFSADARSRLQQLVTNFSEADAERIKQIERVTNHDVKAVEYWLKEQVVGFAELEAAGEFIHFACTSEDINNTSHALMLGRARDQALVPQLQQVLASVQHIAHTQAAQPMLARTHGQPATPTTLGKEFANVAARLRAAIANIEAVVPLAKLNGATGNYNAPVCLS
jgi:adenylosuccinate lyase